MRVRSKFIDSQSASSGQVLTADGAGKSNWVNGYSRSVSAVAVSTTLGSAANTDYLCFASGSGITITLPTAVGNTNRYVIKNTGSSPVTVGTTSSQTIDGSLTAVLTKSNTAIEVASTGSNWSVI